MNGQDVRGAAAPTPAGPPAFSASQRAAAAELAPIVPQLRRETARLLDKAVLAGELVDVDEAAGRHAPCWLHRAEAGEVSKPVVFEIHGGGFATGDARKEDGLCAWIRDSFDAHAVAVEYRKAPEHPYPAALEDVLATVGFFLDNAEAYGMDRSRFYLMGCSAGANLAAAAALKLSAAGACPLAGCVLHYPFFDASRQALEAQGGHEEQDEGLSLPERLMHAFDVWYVDDADPTNPFISPVYASDALLANLPFTSLYPVVGDSLMPDAQRLARRLADAGAPFSFHSVAGAYHGYVEDAANLAVYRATTMPETMASRPAGFVKVAERTVRASLEEVLGPAKRVIAFKEQ